MVIREGMLVVVKDIPALAIVTRIMSGGPAEFAVKIGSGTEIIRGQDDLICLGQCQFSDTPENAIHRNLSQIVINLAMEIDDIKTRVSCLENSQRPPQTRLKAQII